MINLNDIHELNAELDSAMINFTEFHTKMRNSLLFYKNSAFYERQAGQAPDKNNVYQNLLQVFADKNVEYTSKLPLFKVPTTGADPQQRQAASIREKILYATHRHNNTASLQKKWAFDVTLSSVAVAETTFDLKKRCVKIHRYNPRKVFWQRSNDNEQRIIAFWAVFMVTKDEAKKRFGVTPTKDLISVMARDSFARGLDGKEWFTMAIRWDEKTRVKWIGDKLVEEPHNHLMDQIPVDICAPIESGDDNEDFPGFYLDPLIPLQAELNDSFYRRSRMVRRTSSPVVWVRGVPAGKRLDDIKSEMAKPGGGVLGLSNQGEAGLLQVGESRMLNDHEDRIVVAMTRLSGYGNAAFGESVGANTSGDALGMYFNATQRKVEHQFIEWRAFYESINAKILALYDRFMTLNETVNLSGYSPTGTLMPVTEDGKTSYKLQTGMFSESFDRTVINGNYTSVVIPPSTTPKNEIEEKRLAVQAVRDGFLSRTTGYETWGILSPEDEFALVEQEKSNPVFNPQGMQQIVSAMSQAQQAQQPPAPTQLPPGPAPAPTTSGEGGSY